jgi:hypothetical protein
MNNSHLKQMALKKQIIDHERQLAARNLKIKQEVEKFKKETELIAVQSIMATVLITLHDKHGWGKKRLNKLVEESTKNLRCVKEKFVTLDDFQKFCDELGIEGL